MEQRLQLPAPFSEVVDGSFVLVLCGQVRCREHGNLPDVDSVEVLQPGTPPEESSQVDDAEAVPVDPPVIHPAALIGATVLRASLRLGHLDSDLGEVLHDEDETREGENYLRDLSNPLRDLPEGAGGGDVQLLNVVAQENFPQLLDPLVLGEDGQRQPLGPGDQDDFLQVAVDILLILNSSETRMLKET